MNATLQFLGAAGTVTGSKHLIEYEGRKILLDSGLFQGLKELRLRNWKKPTFDPAEVSAVILSHAHIDHSGYLPALVRQGFRGPIYCTSGTIDLLRIMLPDSAHLQEEEAAYANKHNYSKHKPALPLYTVKEAFRTLELLKPLKYGKPDEIFPGLQVLFHRSGHILGSAIVEVILNSARPFRVVFSGDLGRWDQPILRDPELVEKADVLLLESTYGNKTHPADPSEQLARVIRESAARGGALIVPAFAVGRTQELIWMIRVLEDAGKIPILPVYIDSPMAVSTTEIYARHPEDHDLDMQQLTDQDRNPLETKNFHLVRTPDESKKLNFIKGPVIIISASGMAAGGRVLHHLRSRLPDPKTTILLVGFQAAGTRGRLLQDGVKRVRMFGEDVEVGAKIEVIGGLSAHGDQNEIFRWLAGFKNPPSQTYLVHGEGTALESLAQQICNRLHWNVRPAVDGEIVPLGVKS